MNGITVGRVLAIIGEIDRAFALFGLVNMRFSASQLEWGRFKQDLMGRIFKEMPQGHMRLDTMLHESFETEINGIAEQFGIEIFQTV